MTDPLVSVVRQNNQFTHPWTQGEINILRDHYPSIPAKELLRFLNNRTSDGVHRKAEMLSIRRIQRSEYACRNCGRIFSDAISQKRRYCSKKCQNESYKGRTPWWVKRGQENPTKLPEMKARLSKIFKGRKNPHTPEWNQKISLAQKGVARPWESGLNNPSWRGGTSLFRGLDWNTIKRKVLKRDHCTCQRCGRRKNDVPMKKLCIHHMVPYRLGKNNEMSNLVTLCLPCHGIIEWEAFRRLRNDG